MSKTAKATLWIMIGTMLSKILGFFREIVLANFYGTSAHTDVFLVTLNIPGLIIAVIGSAIATMYIPVYISTKEKHGEEEALKFTNNMLNICCVIAIIIAVLGLLFTKEFIDVLAGGFTGAKFDTAVKFTRIMMPGVIFLSASKLLSSYLQANDKFTVPALIGIPYNLIIILAIVVSTFTDFKFLAIGALLAMASQMIFQIPFAFKSSYRYKPYFNLKEENIKELSALVLPMLIGVAIGQLNIAVDRALATTLGDGPLSALNFASRLNDFVMALFVASIITVIYPKLSRLSNGNNKEGFVSTIVKTSNCITLIVLPISVGAIVLAEPIVRILFQRGAFDATSTHMTSIALKLYSLGLIAVAIRDVLIRAFYSLADTKTPMINGSIALLINIVLNFILIKFLGYAGLALSTSIASIVTVLLLFRSLKKKQGYFGGDKIAKTGIKSLIASIIMGGITIVSYKYLYAFIGTSKIEEIIAVALSVLIGAIVYAILIVLFKVDEVKLVFDIIKKTIKR